MKRNNIGLCFVLTLITMLTLGVTSCQKNDIDNKKTLKKLYKMYKDGFIDECKYKGQTVYHAGIIADDAGSAVYDKDGKQIGTCNYAWGNEADPVCEETTDCERVYTAEDNMWGEPAVNKYRLGGLF